MTFKLKILSIVITSVLILSGLFVSPVAENDFVSAKTLHVGGTGSQNYTKIQAAIDAAAAGDTVFVHAGTYKENVFINKSINLFGEDRANTTIDGKGTGNVVQVKANWVNISGLRLTNSSTTHLNGGVVLSTASNVTVTDCNISGNGCSGISILTSNHNNIKNNIITGNLLYGITVRYVSPYNNIINNRIENNNYNNNPSVAAVTVVYFSSNNVISDNIIKNNRAHGMMFYIFCDNNVVKSNSISGHDNGITFIEKDNGNIFYLNEFINNKKHVNGTSSHRTWNSVVKIAYIYNNTNFTNFMGNYWDDYTGRDNNSDGIGDQIYWVGTDVDNYPLVKRIKYYREIPSSTKADLISIHSNSSVKKVSILIHNATLQITVSGDLNGNINITNLRLVMINSGTFSGMGFFTSNWTAGLEGLTYHGNWQGMIYTNSTERKIYLKGTLLGGLMGKTEGYLTESVQNSNKYDKLKSTGTVFRVGTDIVAVDLELDGTVNYQSTLTTSTEIYIFQSLFWGNASGYYNRSLSVVLTHVRIENSTHPFYGFGFSIISYVSEWGNGKGWTYDRTISVKVVNLTGVFTEPLWGIVIGVLDETGVNKTLAITLIRLDLGSEARPIIHLRFKARGQASPGDTIRYLIEYSNIGLKPIKNVEVVLFLPINTTTYNSSTGGGVYNSTSHSVSWLINISAKSRGYLSVKVDVKWGLSWGTMLNSSCYFRDYYEQTLITSASWKTKIWPAVDPNAKHGPDGFVAPGQNMAYTIEFENEGQGKAYGVYFTDTLSRYLDDSTLKIGSVYSKKDNSIIGNPGIYDKNSRTITWFVGELEGGVGGFTTIDIRVRADAVPGSEIFNYGIVYFPSVPEVTPTNSIVSIVRINKAPTAVAGTDIEALTYEQIVFDGSGSIDTDGEIINYTWDFGDGVQAYGRSVTHEYTDNGIYTVKLGITDNNEGTAEHQITVIIHNRAPEANLTADRLQIFTNEDVTFNASGSTDLDGSIVEYNIDFGDGSSSGWVKEAIAVHTYKDGPAVYTVKLAVRDDDGEINLNIAELEISVENRLPSAVLSANLTETFTFEPILFDASLSTDPDGSIQGYYFDFGDDTNSSWLVSPTVSHQYADGTAEYAVRLIVKDDDGETETAQIQVKINNRAPIAEAGPDGVFFTNFAVEFDGAASSDIDGLITSYSWDFGDGEKDTGKTVTHEYADNGEYTVTLKLIDDDGSASTDTCVISIKNLKPIASFTFSPETGDVDTEFEFVSTSYDTDGSIVEYRWDFGDGATADTATVKHRYDTEGTYTVTLTVYDDDGDRSGEYTAEIKVTSGDAGPGPDNDEKGSTDMNKIPLVLSTLVIIIIIILLIAMMVVRKRQNRGQLLAPSLSEDKTLRETSYEVLTDPEKQNLKISREGIKSMLELHREYGNLSENAYDYIHENVLYPEDGVGVETAAEPEDVAQD